MHNLDTWSVFYTRISSLVGMRFKLVFSFFVNRFKLVCCINNSSILCLFTDFTQNLG